jgi:polyhydroxyalkanoate synthase subunit PhaC
MSLRMAPSKTSSPKKPPGPQVSPRVGPRPLALHTAIAATSWLSCAAVLPNSKPGSPQKLALKWHPSLALRANELENERLKHPEAAFRTALGLEIKRRLADFHDGLVRYRKAAYRRDVPPAKIVWQEGTTTVADYAPDAAPDARAVLLVPSLINRAYILDLAADNSLVRYLAAQGFRPFLVDWAAPGDIERGFGLTHYIDGRLAAILGCVEKIAGAKGGKPAVLGYCMGGLLALGLAMRHQARLGGLALLATPWDFHSERVDLAQGIGEAFEPWWPWIDKVGELPVDVLQGLFAALDPFLAARKFRALAGMPEDNPKFNAFVALEDWLNDGVALAAPVARETLVGWYGENTPMRGRWSLGGRAVLPQAIAVPSLCVIPAQDRIVPPASAAALADRLAGCARLEPPLGHIGMVVGGRGRTELWAPLAAWLARLPAHRVGR